MRVLLRTPGAAEAAILLEQGRRPAPLWTARQIGHWMYEPLATEDRVYVGCGDELQSYRADGTLEWSKPSGLVIRRPALSRDRATLYVGTSESDLVAFGLDGTERWRVRKGYGSVGAPTVGPDGSIYVGGTANSVWKLGPGGEELWPEPYSTRGGVQAAPVLDSQSRLFVGDLFGTLHAIGPDGKKLWSVDTHEPFEGSVALGLDGSVVMSRWRSLSALDPATGASRWEVEAPCARNAGPAVDSDGTIYIGCTDGTLRAFSPEGKPLWSVGGAECFVTTPKLGDDGTIVVRDWRRRLWTFDRSGALLWTQECPKPDTAAIETDPAVGPGGRVYSGNQDGTLSAFRTLTIAEQLERIQREREANRIVIEDGAVRIGHVRVPRRRG
ncbi:MAG: PQQ-like beta-propeller repeat protein [Armatimonadetes bacterium]|nr:PQQ-like beta-propeller repeat protein [Armatimonadota bacterium]